GDTRAHHLRTAWLRQRISEVFRSRARRICLLLRFCHEELVPRCSRRCCPEPDVLGQSNPSDHPGAGSAVGSVDSADKRFERIAWKGRHAVSRSPRILRAFIAAVRCYGLLRCPANRTLATAPEGDFLSRVAWLFCQASSQSAGIKDWQNL